MNTLAGYGWATLIVTGFLFGLGFAIAQSLWSALVSVARK